MSRKSSISEKPIGQHPRRLADWLNPEGAKKVHSLVDKVYKIRNLEIAWLRVKENKGCGGIDGESIESFERDLGTNLRRLHEELKTDTYQPQPVRQQMIPKPGQPGKMRPLGIPTIYDRICQQALLNRLEPIFDPVFDDANFGYRKGRSPKDALRKVWNEIQAGNKWIIDADLKDFFDRTSWYSFQLPGLVNCLFRASGNCSEGESIKNWLPKTLQQKDLYK